MPVFALNYTFDQPVDEVEKLMPAHVPWLLEKYEAGVYLMFAKKVPRNGGFCLATAPSTDEMRAIVGTDPLVSKGGAHCDIQELDVTKFNVELASLAEFQDKGGAETR